MGNALFIIEKSIANDSQVTFKQICQQPNAKKSASFLVGFLK